MTPQSDGTRHPPASEGVQPHQQPRHVKSDDVRMLHVAGHVTFTFILILLTSTSFFCCAGSMKINVFSH